MRGILRSHDGNPVTERSGVQAGKGTFAQPPVVGMPFIFMWDEGVASHPSDPSPGIVSFPKKVKEEPNGYMYEDEEGRLFDVKILEES